MSDEISNFSIHEGITAWLQGPNTLMLVSIMEVLDKKLQTLNIVL